MFLKITKYFFYIFLGYLFLGFLILPLIVKPQLKKIIENETNTKVKIEHLYFNPLIFQLTMEDVSFKDLHKNTLFGFETLRINLNPSSLFIGAVQIKELALIDPEINVVYNKDKSINLLKIIKEKKTAPQEKSESNTTTAMPRIIINMIDIEGGKLFYTDYTRKTPFRFSFENIGFSLKDFDTKKIGRQSAGIRFYSRLGDGGFVDLQSQILSLKPLKVQGTLDFEASKLYTEWKYLRDVLKLEVADGKVSFSAKYALNLDDIEAMKIEDLNLALNKLRIKPKDKDKDILNLDTMYVKNVTVFPLKQKVSIEKVGLYGLRIKAKRYADKKIDWIEYLQIHSDDNSSKKVVTQEKKSTPWSVKLHTLALEKIAVVFEDEAIRPAVTSTINELDIYGSDLTLAGEKPFDYDLKLQMNKDTLCDINGSIAHKHLDLTAKLQCSNFDIVHYRPYIDKAAQENLKKYDISLESALLDAAIESHIYENNNSSYTVVLNDANVSLKKVLVKKKSSRKKLLSFHDFSVSGISLNNSSKELNVSNVALNRLDTRVERYKDGSLNLESIIVAKAAKKVKKRKQKEEKGYRVRIATAALKGADLIFLDRSIPKVKRHTVDKINITLKKIDSQKRSWLDYKASLRVNKKGVLQAKGALRHTPLKQKGSLRAKSLSLLDLNPYIQEKSYLNIDDGSVSFFVTEGYEPSKQYPDLRMQGNISLNSLFVTNTNDANSSLFSLDELAVKPFTLELFPNRLYVDNVVLDSFYLSAKIDENKTLNFAKLMKKSQTEKETDDQNSTAQKSEDTKKSPFPIKIVKVDVKNGSAEFQDFSLPIKFKTNIHDLKGVLYAISNRPGDTSYVDIDGEVDKYGSTKLKGSVDSFNPKEYTDLDFNFKNLDLHAMSGYSASFAGYEIDSGKLYLDLGYEILHSELHATNNIMIKQIKLGRELEGKDINHLPLGFVIGLLEDSDGIIDIDMPIEGNVDQPDFKYGALVWKTLGNLIAKAVTSPFKFLGSMMGLNGEELEFIAFEFGKSNITPPQREKLDKIVKMMNKRPKIILQINGTYDEVQDLEALKLQKLVAMVMKKSGDENIKNAKTALTIDMLEDVYSELKKDDALQKLREKLHKEYKDEAYKRAYQNALIQLCIDIQNVTPTELNMLAKQRAVMIKTYLVKEKALKPQRVVEGDVLKVKEADEKVLKLKLNIEVQSKDK